MSYRRLKRIMMAVGGFLVTTGCTGGGCSRLDIPPEEQLQSYIERAVNVTLPEDRERIVELTADPLKSALTNLSASDFKKAYIDTKFEVQTFEVLQRADTGEKECEIDFRIVYRSWLPGENPERAPLVDTRNRAIMQYEYGRWALANVESLDSEFRWEIGLSLDDVEAAPPEATPVEVTSSRDPRLREPEPGATATPAPQEVSP